MTQTLEQKKQKIEEAVKVFRETLEKVYLAEDNKEEFHGIDVFKLTDFINGYFGVNKKGILSVPLKFKCTDLVKGDGKSIPMKFSDWRVFPLIIGLHHEDLETSTSEDPKQKKLNEWFEKCRT